MRDSVAGSAESAVVVLEPEPVVQDSAGQGSAVLAAGPDSMVATGLLAESRVSRSGLELLELLT